MLLNVARALRLMGENGADGLLATAVANVCCLGVPRSIRLVLLGLWVHIWALPVGGTLVGTKGRLELLPGIITKVQVLA